jgi:hypothetical protein
MGAQLLQEVSTPWWSRRGCLLWCAPTVMQVRQLQTLFCQQICMQLCSYCLCRHMMEEPHCSCIHIRLFVALAVLVKWRART